MGLISLAMSLGMVLVTLNDQVQGQVLLPLFSKLRQGARGEFSAKLLRVRQLVLVLVLPPFFLLILFGPEIIEFLYDQRYHRAGIFLSLVALSGAFTVVTLPYGAALLALGDSRSNAAIMGFNVLLRVSCTLAGFWLGGVEGMLASVAIVPILLYPMQAFMVRKRAILHWQLDIGALALIVVASALSYLFRVWLLV
jgi:O-antigen/teichoic acid export membrane protein